MTADCFKGFFTSQDLIKEIGTAYALNFAVFLVYSFVIMSLFELGIVGYALCIFAYELIGLGVCLSFYNNKIREEIKDQSLPITQNLGWYSQEVVKTALGNYGSWVMYDLCIVFVSFARNPFQIASFSILALCPDIFMFVFQGLIAFPKAEIN